MKDPLKLDCELDEIPSEITEKPPSSKKNAAPDDLESSVEDLVVEDLLAVSEHTLDVVYIFRGKLLLFLCRKLGLKTSSVGWMRVLKVNKALTIKKVMKKATTKMKKRRKVMKMTLMLKRRSRRQRD